MRSLQDIPGPHEPLQQSVRLAAPLGETGTCCRSRPRCTAAPAPAQHRPNHESHFRMLEGHLKNPCSYYDKPISCQAGKHRLSRRSMALGADRAL